MHCSTLECELFTWLLLPCSPPVMVEVGACTLEHLAMDSLSMRMFLQIQIAPSVEPQIAFITHWLVPLGAVHLFLQIQIAPSVEPQIAFITHWLVPLGAVHCSHKETFVLILCILFPAPLLLDATGPCIFLITTGLHGQGPVYTATHLHQHSLQVSLFHHNRSVARDQFTLPPTLLTGPICVITGSVNWK